MLSVYYDYQIMLAQKYGGISRYMYEISSRLPALGVDVDMRCIHSQNYYFADKMGIHKSSGLAELGMLHYVNKLMRCFDIMRKRYDIIHPTYYYATKPKRGKFLVTVHDMTHEKYSGVYPVNKRVIAAKRKIIPQADRIIAVSENTKRDILQFFPSIDPAKISVIYHGASMTPKGNEPSPLHEDYVLFVGHRGMYKNFSRFTEAMKEIMTTHKSLHVFCAGGGSFTPEEVTSFGEFAPRFHQAGLNDDELAGAYENALCFVFPSEYEGFGIPVLEAFACDCPVICANASSLPEVAGESALYFDPLDSVSIGEAIMKAVEDDTLREKLRESGRVRLNVFDWNKATRETLECYNQAMKGE